MAAYPVYVGARLRASGEMSLGLFLLSVGRDVGPIGAMLGRPLIPKGAMTRLSRFALGLTSEIACSDAGLDGLPGDLEAFVARRSGDLGGLTRLGLDLVERGLASAVWILERHRFDALDPACRRAWIARWDRSRLAFVRQFVRFYRSIVLLWVFETRYSDSLVDHR